MEPIWIDEDRTDTWPFAIERFLRRLARLGHRCFVLCTHPRGDA